MDYAVAQGATAGVNVTKTVRLVIAEAGETDPKVERALRNGHRVLAPAQAWDALRAASDRREAGLFADGGSARLASGTGACPTDSGEQAPWQSFWRPEELGEGEYHQRFIAPFADRDHAKAPAAASETKGGCAGALLLFVAVSGAVTGTVGGLWPF